MTRDRGKYREDKRSQITLPGEIHEWVQVQISDTWQRDGYRPSISEVIEAVLWEAMRKARE